MKRILVIATVMISLVAVGSLAFGNPGMLPKHPGYPMADSKDPVQGVSTANDPGESAPLPKVALEQAGKYHDSQARNVPIENYPNIVHGTQSGVTDSSNTTPHK